MTKDEIVAVVKTVQRCKDLVSEYSDKSSNSQTGLFELYFMSYRYLTQHVPSNAAPCDALTQCCFQSECLLMIHWGTYSICFSSDTHYRSLKQSLSYLWSPQDVFTTQCCAFFVSQQSRLVAVPQNGGKMDLHTLTCTQLAHMQAPRGKPQPNHKILHHTHTHTHTHKLYKTSYITALPPSQSLPLPPIGPFFSLPSITPPPSPHFPLQPTW